MAIADQINRLDKAKKDMRHAITNRGVFVPTSAKLDEYHSFISQIQVADSSIAAYKNIWDQMTAGDSNYSNLFAHNTNITDLDISNININNVTSMYNMFYGCTNLCSLYVAYGDSWNLTDTSYMFYDCVTLSNLDLSSWYIYNLNYASYMFYNCSNLYSLNLSTWDFNNVTLTDDMFYNCYYLAEFQAPMNINTSISFEYCTELSYDSLMSIINNLTENWSATLTLGSTNLDKLSDDDKNTATSKGWTLA